MTPPNILWICTDQQRFDTIAALGNPWIKTPHLDRLCAEGVSFAHTYCQSPICTPSRASFLTGLYPSSIHVNRNGNSHVPREAPPLITKRLADIGYECGLIGKLHIASGWKGIEERVDDGYTLFRYSHGPGQHAGTNAPGSPHPQAGTPTGNAYIDWLLDQGIDPEDIFIPTGKSSWGIYRPTTDPALRQTAWCANEAISFMEKARPGQPWLLSVNIFDPHPPFDGSDAFRHREREDTIPSPIFRESDLENQRKLEAAGILFQTKAEDPRPTARERTASYYSMISAIDHEVGRMLDVLERNGLRENTIVIFTSDHGETLGDHGLVEKGCRFYECLTHVPLIISWPARFRQGKTVNDLVELTDIAPTLAELAGISLPWTHGRSLLPYLKPGGEPVPRRFVRCEYLDTLELPPSRVTRLPDAKPTYGTMYFDGRWKLSVYHGHDIGELYDLVNDPGEFQNLWDAPQAADKKAELIYKSFDASMVIADPGPPRIGRY